LSGEVAACSTGEQRRDFIHVADAGAALAAILLSDVQGAVNVGSGEAVAVRDMVTEIATLLDARDGLALGAITPARPETPLVVADIARLRNEVGWHPKFSLNEGLQSTIDWWREELRR
jgi:nucleoside-diphosphate-sugar epimerase